MNTNSQYLLWNLYCLISYSSPKVLSCQHSCSAKCLEGWLQTRSKKTKGVTEVECALCRKNTVLPQHEVEALPNNYVINGLLAMLKNREKKSRRKIQRTLVARPVTKTTQRAKLQTVQGLSASTSAASKVAAMLSALSNAKPKSAGTLNADKSTNSATTENNKMKMLM
uniref:uncharacterized protein LOC120340784 n=1 Tax=Styela clava TaxID=7725 RepID=UPI00193A3C1C|nr:uncharacterized protein LOC120340784 [Styela clava]